MLLISSPSVPHSDTPGMFCSATVPLMPAGDAARAGVASSSSSVPGAVRQRQEVLRAVAEAEVQVGDRDLDGLAGAAGRGLLDREVAAEALAGEVEG